MEGGHRLPSSLTQWPIHLLLPSSPILCWSGTDEICRLSAGEIGNDTYSGDWSTGCVDRRRGRYLYLLLSMLSQVACVDGTTGIKWAVRIVVRCAQGKGAAPVLLSCFLVMQSLGERLTISIVQQFMWQCVTANMCKFQVFSLPVETNIVLFVVIVAQTHFVVIPMSLQVTVVPASEVTQFWFTNAAHVFDHISILLPLCLGSVDVGQEFLVF
jgi:hypothetical protein